MKKTHTLHIKIPPRTPPQLGVQTPIVSCIDLLKELIEKNVVPKNPELRKATEANREKNNPV
jgi:uncharacterized protein (UPF0147 family)